MSQNRDVQDANYLFSKWKQLMEEFKRSEGVCIGLYFLISESHKNVVQRSLIQDNVNFNVIVDINKEISSMNDLPYNERYSVLLLDEKNRIQLIGNPIYSSKLKNMYTNIMSTSLDKKILENNE